jgi:vacuolar-type H+-ATPase subunit H
MSTPKEKAEELFDKFYQYANEEFEDKLNEYPGQVLSERRKIRKVSSKQCALICVDEMLKVAYFISDEEIYEFLLKVKEEIEKL